ncbi:protein-arginine deiminase type-1-like isoform X2 [Xenopus tropicalis]|uniref:protein-arginine deiminase n=1 Tax=Xenopus tropicalis TaxID=8364 RepID=A0A8J1JWN3_XENTR|nr:protein-arginine deiminase type-1-like isoform X2 [Xenopus tropicalis]
MAQRSIATSYRAPTYDVCVVGQELTLDIYRSVPSGAEYFEILRTPPIDITLIYDENRMEKAQKGHKLPLNKSPQIVMSPTEASAELNDCKVKIFYYGKGDSPLDSALLYLTCVYVSLDADGKRTGAVSRGVKDKGSWSWGPNGTGAILLVNCDRDRDGNGGTDNMDAGGPNAADIKDMSPMVLTVKGPKEVFKFHQLILQIPPPQATKLRVYQKSESGYLHILGGAKLSCEVQRGKRSEMEFYVEGLDFPDVDFPGLVHISLSFQRISDTEIFAEKVAFRLTPWIMTPNTQKPLEVYVCSVRDNWPFLKQMLAFVRKARCQLNICPEMENCGDRWMQDEMEFGYIEAPHKGFPVVLDSPRNRGLKGMPFSRFLGRDFGYVTREPEYEDDVSDLDCFGNLEVSPPVTVKGKSYPLGRILIGGALPNSDLSPPDTRTMAKVVTDFLKAQLVQSPVELFSDWLLVGHIDEFMSFVPTHDKKGFRLLLASPNVCLELFREKEKKGYGGALMFEGLDVEPYSISEILSDAEVLEGCAYAQKCIEWNRDLMKEELGLSEEDIIDIPVLFKLLPRYHLAEAFFPNMVNMLVLGQYLGIPKPFGPIIDGRCCLEQKVCSLLEPLDLDCTFIDDFATYHQKCGEVHCGTNVIRKPFPQKWWHCLP